MTQKIIYYCLLLVLYFGGLYKLTAQSPLDTQKVSTFIERSFSNSPVKGLVVSIVQKDKLVISKSLGTDLGEPISASTPLFLGSVSKTFTALAICLLHDQGKLNLSDPLERHIKRERLHPEIQDGKISINDLLHHHSGFSQLSGYDREVEFEGVFDKIKPIDSAGLTGRYSSFNYALLGQIIESSSGMDYQDFMEQEVFKPLGMNNTFVPDEQAGKKLRGYCLAYGLPIETEQMSYGHYIIPAGYIVSTLNDLNKYSQLFLNEGKIKTSIDSTAQFIEQETFKAMFTPYGNQSSGFGKSWGIGKIKGKRVYSHEGMSKISNSSIFILPDEGLAINIIANTNSGPFFSISSTLSDGIINIIDQKEAEEKAIWEYIIRLLMGFLVLKTIFQLIKSILKWKREGFQTKIHKPYKIHTFVFDSIPLLVLIFLPGIIGVSLDMLLRIMPDIGFAVLISGIISGMLICLHLILPKTEKQQ